MAKYTVTRACGHTETVDLIGRSAERESKLAWMRKTDCKACYTKGVNERKAQLAACNNAQDIMRYVMGADYDIANPQELEVIEDTLQRIIDNKDAVPATQLREGIEWAIGQTFRRLGSMYLDVRRNDKVVSYEARAFVQAMVDKYC